MYVAVALSARGSAGVPSTRAHSCWKEKCQMYCGSRSDKERGSGQLIKPVGVIGRLVGGIKLRVPWEEWLVGPDVSEMLCGCQIASLGELIQPYRVRSGSGFHRDPEARCTGPSHPPS